MAKRQGKKNWTGFGSLILRGSGNFSAREERAFGASPGGQARR
jgi:hypothetical protein